MEVSEVQRDWLTLMLVPGIGTAKFIRLLSRFKTPGAVLNESEAELAEIVGSKLAQRIRQYRDVVDVDRQIRLLNKYDAGLITMDDLSYPTRLAEIYDPPLVLFHRGEPREEDACCVAMVGTRNPTDYGYGMARKLAGELAARGITVVSGMAAGIDAAAHRGALEAGGRTIAVLGCGVDIVYPSENADLMHKIIQRACVLSPFPMGVKPSKGLFPNRNRIISGLCLGTVVIEAPPGSGALITARQAAEQGREVFALPGQVGQRNSMGPHALIREGARLVETAEDILVELELPGPLRLTVPPEPAMPEPAAREQAAASTRAAPPAPAPQHPVVSDTEQVVLEVLGPEGSFVDEIAMACRISISEALSSLTMLELKGLVRQFSGKRFAQR